MITQITTYREDNHFDFDYVYELKSSIFHNFIEYMGWMLFVIYTQIHLMIFDKFYESKC